MRIRLLTGRVDGDGGVWRPGDEVDVDDAEAKRLLEDQQAEPVAVKKTDRRETR